MRNAISRDISRANAVHRVTSEILPQASAVSERPMTRFGHKVFIRAIWDALVNLGIADFDTYAEFQRWLLQAMLIADDSGRPLVVLARADLVAAMDPYAVRDSEIRDRGAMFHFVVDREHSIGCLAYRPATFPATTLPGTEVTRLVIELRFSRPPGQPGSLATPVGELRMGLHSRDLIGTQIASQTRMVDPCQLAAALKTWVERLQSEPGCPAEVGELWSALNLSQV